MNKQNKLARNAIRARKAKNKRANEQDKPKKGKRWLIRLGALVGCLLLVSALVVPCFAQSKPDVEGKIVDIIYDSFYENNVSNFGYEAFNSLMFSNVSSFESKVELFEYYAAMSGGLVTGDLNDVTSPHPLPISMSFGGHDAAGDDIFRQYYQLDLSNADGNGADMVIVYGPYDDRVTLRYDNISISYVFEVSYSTGYPILRVYFRFGSTANSVDWDEFAYVSLDRNNPAESLVLGGVKINGVGHTAGFLEDADIAIRFKNQSDIYMLSALYRLFFGVVYEDTLQYGVVYPNYYFSTSVLAGYGAGYGAGEESGYQNGYNAGYSDAEGQNYDYAFTEGYNQAVSEIDSDEFGRNFLIGVFNAPMDALNEFTIASWQTSDGQTMRVTLGLVLGSCIGIMIFMWFLKMFAGG